MTETAVIPSSDPWLSLRPDPHMPYPVSPSPRLVRALEAYATAEAHDLADCEDLAQRSEEPFVKLLLGLLIDDEQRHQSLLESMVQHLQGGIRMSPPVAIAPLDHPEPLSDLQLAAALRSLIRDEHEGARHLRHVGRQEAPVYGGLYSLLLEVIARDAEKHAAILRYLLTRLERRPA